ncbi:MAG TPA: ABC transporter ATP-binding protein [Candidatus Polarisedimenticolaceae bacterium]|nr:ABC transporter ATP-binding protein [Candidatus Polarisedimenticolaceae bacterium]
MTIPAVEIRGLVKEYREGFRRRRTCALDGLEVTIPQGIVFGLLGPNGAGKSTAFHVLLGFLRPTRGTARLLGRPIEQPASRRSVGFLPEIFAFDGFSTAEQLLRRFDAVAGHALEGREARVREALRAVGLEDAARRKVGRYSKGMMQRVGLAQALLGDPDLVLLDEPMSGMDPAQRLATKEMLQARRRRGKTTVFSSHILADVEDVVDRILILQKGKVVQEAALDALRGGQGMRMVVIRLPQGAEPDLGEVHAHARGEDGAWRLTVHEDRLEPLLAQVIAQGAKVLQVTPQRRSLEDLFLEITGQGSPS